MEESSSSSCKPSSESDSSSSSDDRKRKHREKSSKKDKSSKPNKNDKGRFTDAPIKQENTMSEVEKKRKREDEKLSRAEKKKGGKSESKDQKQSPKSSRASQFSDDELKTILFSLFKGKDDREATEDFMKAFPKSSRTRPAVKAKVAKMREDFSNQINNITDKDMERNGVSHFFSLSFFSLHFLFTFSSLFSFSPEGSTALKFLTPALISNDNEILFVHQKSHWKSIEVGHNDTHVRFGLRKIPFLQNEGATAKDSVEFIATTYLQFEIPLDHVIESKFENDELKGVKLRVREVRGKEKNDFSMS